MKRYLIIISFFTTLCSFADAGNAYRFNLELVSIKGDTIHGYYYHYSYDEYDKYSDYDEGFKKFIKTDSITLYSFITTIDFEGQSLDFTTKTFRKDISISDFWRIRISDFLDFMVGTKLTELSQDAYNLIETSPPKYEGIYNAKYAENCSFVILSWEPDYDLIKHKNEISKKLKILSEDLIKNQDELHKYIDQKRKNLLKERVILTSVCSAL